MVSIDSVKVVTHGWIPIQHEPERMAWKNEFSDILSLNFFPRPPDLPRELSQTEELYRFYAKQLLGQKAALISVDVADVRGLQAVKTVIAFRDLTREIYLASQTFPFADFSFVTKLQCAEAAPLGLRNATLLDRFLAGNPAIEGGRVKGWMKEAPYLEGAQCGTLADDETHDSEFPRHALSRARRCLKELEATISFNQEVSSARKFWL